MEQRVDCRPAIACLACRSVEGTGDYEDLARRKDHLPDAIAVVLVLGEIEIAAIQP